MFTINGKSIKSRYNYKIHPRTKVTTTIRSKYYDEYKNLMDHIDQEYCKGFDIMIELLSEDEELLKQFIDRVKRY